MRAIDADALQLAIVEEGQADKRKKYTIGDIWELTGAEIREVINSQPTIQPEPLRPWEVLAAQAVLSQPAEPKRGKWIRDGHHIRCDQCGMYMCDTDREGDRIPTEFCPNCGAKMEVDDE